MKERIIDMVLTSVVNNQYIFNSLCDDINNRFKTVIDREKLHNFLNTYEEKSNTISVK